MIKRKRHQLKLLEENPPETAALFDSQEFPYDTPDEIAYNAKRMKDGLFEITPAEETARKQALENGTVRKREAGSSTRKGEIPVTGSGGAAENKCF